MLDLSQIKGVLYKEANFTILNIVQNMLKPAAPFNVPTYKSGRTATSLRQETDADSLVIFAPDYFPMLETGISPSDAKRKSERDLAKALYGWSFDADMAFEDNKKRYRFALYSARKQQIQGSALYRIGGRKDIYSNEVDPLVERIKEGVGQSILDIQIIKK